MSTSTQDEQTTATPLPHFMNASGRTFGKEEEELVIQALRTQWLDAIEKLVQKKRSNDRSRGMSAFSAVKNEKQSLA